MIRIEFCIRRLHWTSLSENIISVRISSIQLLIYNLVKINLDLRYGFLQYTVLFGPEFHRNETCLTDPVDNFAFLGDVLRIAMDFNSSTGIQKFYDCGTNPHCAVGFFQLGLHEFYSILLYIIYYIYIISFYSLSG